MSIFRARLLGVTTFIRSVCGFMSAADLPCETLLAINCSAKLGRIINALITHFSTEEWHATIRVPDKLAREGRLITEQPAFAEL